MYQQHPSPELNELFRVRPFQGVPPESAEFLFVGLDANYAPELERSASFTSILDYHRDGVAFWRRHGVHHPFLLPGYRGDGRLYHRNFARIGFNSRDADRISFVELLHVPTIGRNRLDVEDLDPIHLDAIGAIVKAGEHRHVFLSAGVVKLMRKSCRFDWLVRQRPTQELLPVLYRQGKTCVYLHLHFSSYGKFKAQMDREAMAIAGLARKRPEVLG